MQIIIIAINYYLILERRPDDWLTLERRQLLLRGLIGYANFDFPPITN